MEEQEVYRWIRSTLDSLTEDKKASLFPNEQPLRQILRSGEVMCLYVRDFLGELL